MLDLICKCDTANARHFTDYFCPFIDNKLNRALIKFIFH